MRDIGWIYPKKNEFKTVTNNQLQVKFGFLVISKLFDNYLNPYFLLYQKNIIE